MTKQEGRFWFIVTPEGKFRNAKDSDSQWMFDIVGYKTRAGALAGLLSHYPSETTWKELRKQGWRLYHARILPWWM
jgi:hypothetical protein